MRYLMRAREMFFSFLFFSFFLFVCLFVVVLTYHNIMLSVSFSLVEQIHLPRTRTPEFIQQLNWHSDPPMTGDAFSSVASTGAVWLEAALPQWMG